MLGRAAQARELLPHCNRALIRQAAERLRGKPLCRSTQDGGGAAALLLLLLLLLA